MMSLLHYLKHYLKIAFEILSPCTKIHSHTRLYDAAASSLSRPREGDSLAVISSYLSLGPPVIFLTGTHTEKDSTSSPLFVEQCKSGKKWRSVVVHKGIQRYTRLSTIFSGHCT